MCPTPWANPLTSTSTTRSAGSSRCASSHPGSTRTPAARSPAGAFVSGAIFIWASLRLVDSGGHGSADRLGRLVPGLVSPGCGPGKPVDEPGEQLVDGPGLLHVDHVAGVRDHAVLRAGNAAGEHGGH